jgi:hypothetical protein
MVRLDHLTTVSEKRITEAERRIIILEYVNERQKSNKNTTKSAVIRYMKEKKLSSRETTLNLINELVREGKLNKKELNSQVHFLTINKTNEFVLIDAGLTAFEVSVDGYLHSLHELYKKTLKFDKYETPLELTDSFTDLKQNFNETVQSFIVMIGDKIHSEEDAQILYRRIQKILQKGPPGFWDPQKIKGIELSQSISQTVENFKKHIQSQIINMNVSSDKEDRPSGRSKPKAK